MKKTISFFLSCLMLLTLSVAAVATESAEPKLHINGAEAKEAETITTIVRNWQLIGVSPQDSVTWSAEPTDGKTEAIFTIEPSTAGATHSANLTALRNGTATVSVSNSEAKVLATCNVTVNIPLGTVEFVSADNDEVLSTIQGWPDTSYSAPSPAPSRTGYTFGGWYTSKKLKSEFNFSTNVFLSNGGTKKVWAKWTINKYAVTFVDGNGTQLSSAEYEYNTAADAITVPADPTREGYTFAGWTPEITAVTENVTYTAKWTPKVTAGGTTYDTLNDALKQVEDKTEIPVLEETALDDDGALTAPANSKIMVESSANAGSGETAASAKELTITKSDNTSETAYLVTKGGVTSAVKSNDVDNVITGKDKNGGTISTEAEAKAAVAKMFNVPKVLAAIASKTNTAVNDVNFSMKVTQEGVTHTDGHYKTFEVHPVAKFGTTEIEVPADARTAQEYNVTLDFDAANVGRYVKITHYKSVGGTENLGSYLIGADGKVTFPTTSFSEYGGDLLPQEYGAMFTMTVEASKANIEVDEEVAFEVKLTSTVATNLNTMKFSYSLPAGFTETGKTGTLAGAVAQTGGDWLWQSAQTADIALTADTPVSLGTIKATVAQANAVYNEDKTFTFNPATLTFSGAAYTEKTTDAASATTKVTTTYAITWDYNGGKAGDETAKTDTVGVNVTPTAPAPVKPGYTLSWTPTVAKATTDVTYTAVWTLDTSDMSVQFNDYGYAYVNSTDSADYDKLLVLKAPVPTSGYAYAIDGNLMFATTEANYRNLVSAADNETVYVYLVGSATTSDNVLGATPRLSVVEGTNETIVRDGDLNRDNSVKQGDLGVLVDLFKTPGLYNRTGVVGVRARLEADIDNSANAENSFKSIADVNAIIGKLFPASGG